MRVEPPKPCDPKKAKGDDHGSGFDAGAQGVANVMPGGKALSRYRFPPPLEAVEEESEGLVADSVPYPAPASIAEDGHVGIMTVDKDKEA